MVYFHICVLFLVCTGGFVFVLPPLPEDFLRMSASRVPAEGPGLSGIPVAGMTAVCCCSPPPLELCRRVKMPPAGGLDRSGVEWEEGATS